MDFTHLLTDIPADGDFIRTVLHSGNTPPLSEFVGLKAELEQQLETRQVNIPKTWLIRYKSILYVVDYLTDYYQKNNLPLDFSVHERKL